MNPESLAHLNQFPTLTRRDFGRMVAALGMLGYIDGTTAAMALTEDKRRLGWLSNRAAGAEGVWDLADIEGAIPKELDGTLYRIAPGQKETFGVTLNHLFDGDAFVSGYSIRDGKVRLRAKFVETPQRLEELAAGRMIYNEFGTLAPPAAEGAPKPKYQGKNQPSVNVIAYDGRLLGLSEGGHPTAINPKDLSFAGYWDFYGTLPASMPFTAHPKFDPNTGDMYAYGVMQGPTMALTVYRMEPNGKLTQLFSIPQKGYFMVHDMFMSKEHLIFAIPPVRFNVGEMFSGKATPAMALRWFENEPLRFVIMRRDGTGKPVTIEQPASMVFHNGNAFEWGENLVLDTFLSPDGTVLDMLSKWSAGNDIPEYPGPKATRLVLNPATGAVVSRTEFAADQEFPRFDIRRSGEDLKYLYVAGAGIPDDPLAVPSIVRHDFATKTSAKIDAGKGRTYGETVFVAHPGKDAEDAGWLLTLGYDGARDETYLEINDAGSLEFQARVWTGNHFPLGFHGNFSAGMHVA